MLNLLVKYAQDHGLEVKPGFKPKEARWAICCDADGSFLDVVELGDTGSKRNRGQLFSKCPDLSQPELVTGSSARSHFLVETAEVAALHGKGPPAQKTLEKHACFVELLRQAGSVMPELGRLAESLARPQTLAAIQRRMAQKEQPKLKPTDKVTFRLGSAFPVESNAWHQWWRDFRKRLGSEAPAAEGPTDAGARRRSMLCFVTGTIAVPAATHPKIEGLADVGGQPSGSSLIGFDKESFASYGLEQSANAAVSEEGAAAYRSALNDLIRNHATRLAGAKVVHWYKGPLPQKDDPLAWLEEGAEREELSAQKQAKDLLSAIRAGQRADLADNTYHALTLSGSGGRVMVRDWMEGRFETLVENVGRWFEDLSIVHRDGYGLAALPKFLAVLGATARTLDDLAPPLVGRMWRVAVRGEAIPRAALAGAVARARADFLQDQPPNHARMGLIRAYHVRKHRQHGGGSMSTDLQPFLNEQHPNPAYHCGRLMAVLAALQRAALGDVGAGIVQRYYAAASSTPALVLGRLVRTSQFHLNKLDPGLAYWYEARIADIWGRIKEDPPRTLNLEEQGVFAMGYYQQLAQRPHKSAKKDTYEPEEAKHE
jgi:CRISPR-associated protein Csd1